MSNLVKLLFLMAALMLCWPGQVIADGSGGGVPLTGEYMGPPKAIADLPEAGLAKENGTIASRYGDLPVLDEALRQKAAGLPAIEKIRVIISLAYHPHEVIAEQVKARYSDERREIREQAKSIIARYAQDRVLQAPTDAENYQAEALVMSAEDMQALRQINERNEALKLRIKNEIAAALSEDLGAYQQGVKDAILALGGTVEFGIIAGNVIVALVPAGALEQIASMEKVGRMVEDRRIKQHLNIADDATKVNAANGLWVNGFTGGAYDPAVIDSGTDLSHPAMADNASRANFYSWYLVAGFADPFWNDAITQDDLAGHGTHVAGIVGSYGSAGWADYLGMSYGVDKFVTLKSGWRGLDGRAYMYWSDAMWIIDRALYHTDQLYPTGTFSDDVDGMVVFHEVVITRHDKVVARLVPEGPRRLDEVRRAVSGLLELQKRIRRRSRAKLSDRQVRSAIEEGRS